MSFAWALTPIDVASPCGSDLDATDDSAFLDYYYDALSRIPERYIKPGLESDKGRITEDEVFDPKSIDIKTEVATIKGLLERSRDLRLFSLWAQFECLAGRLEPLADVIEAMADALEEFGDDLHPQSAQNDGARRDAIQDLAQPIAMVTGLRHMGLVGSSTVTLRLLMVADDRLTAHSGEGEVSGSALRGALAGAENAKAVEASFAALVRISESIARIKTASQAGTKPYSPNLSATQNILEEMRAEIVSAKPDLRGAAIAEAPTDAETQETEGQGGTGADPAPRLQTALASHDEARQALIACEVYFQRNEPSSASLLLVRQARQLIGQPLVAALEVLLPEKCGNANVDFGAQTGFVIPAARLKSLSDEGLPAGVPAAPAPDALAEPPIISGPSDVSATLRNVEDFFNARERSSPVPVLLQRARNYLEKSFQEIVDELISK